MVKKIGCDFCNKDYNQGSGSELKVKLMSTGLTRMADVCQTCYETKIAPLVAGLTWMKWNKEQAKWRTADE